MKKSVTQTQNTYLKYIITLADNHMHKHTSLLHTIEKNRCMYNYVQESFGEFM